MGIKSIILISLGCSALLGMPVKLLKAKELQKCPDKGLSPKTSQSPVSCTEGQTLVVKTDDICVCQSVILEGELCENPDGCQIGVLLDGDEFLTLSDKKCKKGWACHFKNKPTRSSVLTRAQKIYEMILNMAELIPRGLPCPSEVACVDQTWTTHGDLVVLKPGEMSVIDKIVNSNLDVHEYRNYDLSLIWSKGEIESGSTTDPCPNAYCSCPASGETGEPVDLKQNTQNNLDPKNPPTIRLGTDKIAVPAGFKCGQSSSDHLIRFGEVASTEKKFCRASMWDDVVIQKSVECKAGQVCGYNLMGSQCAEIIEIKNDGKKIQKDKVSSENGKMYALKLSGLTQTSEALAGQDQTSSIGGQRVNEYYMIFCRMNSRLLVQDGRASCVEDNKRTHQIWNNEICFSRNKNCNCFVGGTKSVSCTAGQICYDKNENDPSKKKIPMPDCKDQYQYVECPYKDSCNFKNPGSEARFFWNYETKKTQNTIGSAEKNTALFDNDFTNQYLQNSRSHISRQIWTKRNRRNLQDLSPNHLIVV